MRKSPFLGLILCLLTFFTTQVKAQVSPNTPITLNQAVQEAIANNLGLLAERYNVTMAEAQIITARLRPNPVLTLDVDHLDLLGTGYNSTNNAGPSEYSIRTDFTFERGKKRELRIEVAQNARTVVELQLMNTVRQLVIDIQSAYVDVLLAKANLQLAQENLNLFNEIVEISAARVRAGDLAAIELTRSKVAALQFKNAVLQANAKLKIARNRLQLLIGRTTMSTSFDVMDGFRRDIQPLSLEQVQQKALELRPDRQAIVHDQIRSLANLRLQLAQSKADFTFGTEYRRQQGLAGRGNSLGFFLSIPLTVFNRNQGEIQRVRQEQKQIEAKLRALDADIYNETQNVYQQYETAKTLLESIETTMLKQAQEVFNTMEYSYRHGEASFVELLDAQRALNDTKQGYNEARAEYARSLYQLDSVINMGVNP